MVDKDCRNCIFFEAYYEERYEYAPDGECHRFPPNHKGSFPKIKTCFRLWCGEWKAKNA